MSTAQNRPNLTRSIFVGVGFGAIGLIGFIFSLEIRRQADEPTPTGNIAACESFRFAEYRVLIESNSDMGQVALHHMNQARNILNLCLQDDFEGWWTDATLHMNEAIRAQSMLHSWLINEEETNGSQDS